MTNKIEMSLEYEQYDNFNKFPIVSIYLGEFLLKVRGDDRHITDYFYDGICDVGVPSNAANLFIKHKLYEFTDKSNPTIMSILRKVFIDQDNSGFKSKKLNNRRVKCCTVDVSNDQKIQGLLNDPEFKALNRRNDQ
ncbi:MAG: hypothetical protein LBJ75_02845 [Puniceicoccales bacterium]|jgi:hypothetical protein|nr:hypothetical protein [Puniceicoccales bacterium]